MAATKALKLNQVTQENSGDIYILNLPKNRTKAQLQLAQVGIELTIF